MKSKNEEPFYESALAVIGPICATVVLVSMLVNMRGCYTERQHRLVKQTQAKAEAIQKLVESGLTPLEARATLDENYSSLQALEDADMRKPNSP